MKRILRSAVSLLLCAAVALGGTACGRSKLPTTITIWTYYNGDQLECFNQLVEQFNSTVGKEKNIRVESSSQGSVNDLETSVLAAAEGKVGAEKLPNIVSSYADTAFTLDQMGLAVDLSPYLTEKEKSAYIAGFLEEGDLMNNGELKVFPIAKSTELLYLNTTDFAPFAEATGVTYADLSTVEGLNEAAHKYYDWTDAQTAAPNDGKALYGRDALANYLLCGAQELGTTIFDAENGVMTLNLDKDVMRKLWDNYYVPFVRGWFAATGRFRSDDIKTGNVLAYVGSSSSATFFPKQVLTSDTESHDIEMAVLPCPSFSGCAPVAAQQGAGMITTVIRKARAHVAQSAMDFAEEYKNDSVIYTMGSGAGYGAAYMESICIFMEMQWIHSGTIHTGEFFHGPFEVTDANTPFVIQVSEGSTRELDERCLKFLHTYAKRIEVLDAKELGLSVIDPAVVDYFNHSLFNNVYPIYNHALAETRQHPLTTRRYMWKVAY